MSANPLAEHPVHLLIMAQQKQQKTKRPNNAVSPVQDKTSSPTANPVVAPPTSNGNGKPVAQFQQSTFSGPMPPPSLLEGYELLIPGAAERILKMAESDAKHQQEIEFAALRVMESERKRGQHYGFVIGLAALVTSILALYMGFLLLPGLLAAPRLSVLFLFL